MMRYLYLEEVITLLALSSRRVEVSRVSGIEAHWNLRSLSLK